MASATGEYDIVGVYGCPNGDSEVMLRLKRVDGKLDELAVLVRKFDSNRYSVVSTSRTPDTFNVVDTALSLYAVSWKTDAGHSQLMVSADMVVWDGVKGFPLPVSAVMASGADLVLDVDASGYNPPLLGLQTELQKCARDGQGVVVCKLIDPTCGSEPAMHVMVDGVEEVVALNNLKL